MAKDTRKQRHQDGVKFAVNRANNDRYSMDFGLDSRFVFDSEEKVAQAQQGREQAKATFHNTKKGLTHMLAQATYAVKTGKAIANFKKALLGLKLIHKGTDASLELAEHKADLGGQAVDHRLAEAKNHAVAAYEQNLQQITSSFENRRNKQIGGSK